MVFTYVLPRSPLSSLCLPTYRHSPSRSVPTHLCTFCTQLFCYLNKDILIFKILNIVIFVPKIIVRRKFGYMTHQMERVYKVFSMVDSSSNNPQVIISRMCVKVYPVAFLKIQDGRQNSMKSVFSL